MTESATENALLEPATGPHPDDAEPAPLGTFELDVMLQRLREEPEVMMEKARAVWDSDLTEDELRRAVASAREMLHAPDEAIRHLEAGATFAEAATPQLPVEFFQDDLTGWDPKDPSLRIDPGNTKFETKADLVNWVLFGGAPILGAALSKKAPFRWHRSFKSGFVYEREAPTTSTAVEVALVSDFGTGLYHSNYIAKTLRERRYPYVIHGGDVYYAGRASEFSTNFRPQLDPLLALDVQVLTLNANHEMYSSARPYFQYISDRKNAHTSQVQEGSYFCLRFGSAFQVIGIDTAYFRNGRYDEPELQIWLESVLTKGRQDGSINVLFSSNQPYDYGTTDTTGLLDDLRALVDRRLIDLWFWGNTHHCALYDRTPKLAFIGSCVGHGGYPYGRVASGRPSGAPVRFLETTARFPAYTNVRQDRGNNGFCEMSLRADRTIQLRYIDWTRRERCRVTLDGGGEELQIAKLEL